MSWGFNAHIGFDLKDNPDVDMSAVIRSIEGRFQYVEDVHTEEYEVGFDVNLSGEKVTWEDFYDKVQKTAEKYKVTLKIEYTSEYSDRVWESVAFVGPDSHKLYQEYVYQKLEEYMTTTFLINADYLAHEGYKDKVISLLDRVNAQMEKYK